jgi:hypothetical protein
MRIVCGWITTTLEIIRPPHFDAKMRLRFEALAGVTRLDSTASGVTGRRSNLNEAACANVKENYLSKGVLREETAGA